MKGQDESRLRVVYAVGESLKAEDVKLTYIGTIAPNPVRLKSSSINSSLTSAKYSCPTILQ